MARNNTHDDFSMPTGTVIGKDFTIHSANFTCPDAEAMRIDGVVVGDISIDGMLNLSASGCIDGNIICASTRIAGRVNGNIRCRNIVHLASTADVNGDIMATSLIVDDGAIFTGRCQTHVSQEDVAAYALPRVEI